MRIESDLIGEVEIPTGALYGIHSVRAVINFPANQPFHLEWYKALGIVKQACYNTARRFRQVASSKGLEKKLPPTVPSTEILDSMAHVASKIYRGEYFEYFIIPGISGGAGTSMNMNVNEIIANAALQELGYKPGDYHKIDPVEDANIFQSTNDVVPTALKVAAMFLLAELENNINLMRSEVERIEGRHRYSLRIGYTQMQEAVPTSYGKMFSSWSEAFSRDWWRISKCVERLKLVNLGGGAIGTGLTLPRFFIMEVVQELQRLTDLPVARSENPADATSNLDSLVEVHSIVKALAVNLEKFTADIRLLASDIAGKQLIIPSRQAGSSIMPGKVNPVIPEYIIGCTHQVYSNDILITSLCAQGCLELNAYTPVIGHALLGSLKLLNGMCKSLVNNLLKDLDVDVSSSFDRLLCSPTIVTALIPYIGYHQAEKLALFMKQHKCNIGAANEELKVVHPHKLSEVLLPSNLLKLGYSLTDLPE